MEIRHLRYFIAVAEELHFGRAAARLHIAQPPLSRQLRRLQEEVGVALLNRVGRRTVLTDAGQVFLEEARLILEQTRHAVRAAQAASRGEIGRMTIGFINSATFDALPAILPAFRARFPEIAISLRELPTAQQIHALHSGKIHLGFVRTPVRDDEVALEPLIRGPLLVALPTAHRLASRSKVPVEALANEPFVLFPRKLTAGHYGQILSICKRAGFVPNIVQEAMEVQTILSLVAAGIGVTFVGPSIRHLQREGVVYRELDAQPAPVIETALAWRRDDESNIVHAFLGVAREVMGRLESAPDVAPVC